MNSKDDSLKLLKILTTQKFLETKGGYPAKEQRNTECLKDPERTLDYQDEWFIYVPSCFNDCLDIAKTDRVVKTVCSIPDQKIQGKKTKKKTEKVWTQGSRFAFHHGCTLYDTPKAYGKWGDAINEIKYCISIQSGASAEPAMNEKERNPGIVKFSTLSLSAQTTNLEKRGIFTLTQDKFIDFLISGNPQIIPK
jgi:hypothetical protein